MAGIYTPDSGNIQITGKLTPFIELGVGFNPELSGRDNVFLNGALLGFSRQEMVGMYDEIVEFAELEKFMDQKLKNYSSGMQVRLAFSIAIRAQTDILILDEVLAVGDENFQKKCTDYFVRIKNSGKTIILVTHDMGSVERFCDRVMIVNNAEIIGIMDSREASIAYQELNIADTTSISSNHRRWGTKDIFIDSIATNSPVKTGDKIELIIRMRAKRAYKEDQPIVVGIAFYDEDGINISGPNSKGQKLILPATRKKLDVHYKVAKNILNKGVYRITVAIFDPTLVTTYDNWIDATNIHVVADKEYHGKVIMNGEWSL